MQLRLSDVRAFPLVAITVLMAIVLCLFGIYVIIPPTWWGLDLKTSYPSIIGRSIFGVLTAYPAIMILYYNVRYSLHDLIKNKYKRIRPYIFWMGVVWSYITILRIIGSGWLPPVFLIYLAMAVISFIIWFSNKYM
jgi:hypothetical protein